MIKQKIISGAVILVLGIGMLFFNQTESIAPFIIGFGVGLIASD